MKIGVFITSNDTEKAWNAIRYMNVALEMGHSVTAFLMNSGVEVEFMDHELFDIQAQWQKYAELGGKLYSCGTCLQFRKRRDDAQLSTVTTMIEAVKITEESDKVLTF
ncbi:hypothetical protein B9T11_00695 [Wohlfahrtiimonas chitiniclastica]|uniref:DsrE family protein n=1 Tax=Wohlfahrtiimonas chitiniclastica TaxID=400946 RepID=A0AB35BVV9_9GAMM|nr:DsrE family protein [Wohlfahrtiimonas chitiniclastica]MBS7817830.1 DsrE family protein [Wohlfahrtiimonas chitiniclastica]MBS7823834.1 DsrE family protein [Wohlfahrtiimonas chitiniclastica]MBS7825797.1 DsrE family protein [Wohlfahrtiimonas chitiniclastica]MBS7839452.1 DsrE family protein [Wohlfahrtiimonas chitiniclastica]OYQ71487.1 hypothetical protein B9T13_02105 [Wohlfahrtiimonas chitiniclastica]